MSTKRCGACGHSWFHHNSKEGCEITIVNKKCGCKCPKPITPTPEPLPVKDSIIPPKAHCEECNDTGRVVNQEPPTNPISHAPYMDCPACTETL